MALTQAEKLDRVEHIIEYQFSDREILLEALIAPSAATHAGSRDVPDGNKRLAILGGAVLQLLLVFTGYENGQTRGEQSSKEAAVAEPELTKHRAYR